MIASLIAGTDNQIGNDIGFITVDPSTVDFQLFNPYDAGGSYASDTTRVYSGSQPKKIETYGIVTLGASTTLNTSPSYTGGAGNWNFVARVYKCDGTLIEQITATTPTGGVTFATSFPAGTYVVYCSCDPISPPASDTERFYCNWNITAGSITPILFSSLGCIESPACAYECLATHLSGCPSDPRSCAPISYPFTVGGCVPTEYDQVLCPCGDPPSDVQITVQVRMVLTGLTNGTAYTATVYWYRIDDPTVTGSYAWSFTATGSTETTSYTSVPDPSAYLQPGWAIYACSLA